MDYVKVLKSCNELYVGEAVLDSLRKLFEFDLQLLSNDASERSIASHVAQYLKPHFHGFHVDVDYNRMGSTIKKVAWRSKKKQYNVYPDIIIHTREKPNNKLAIEIKKDSNLEEKSKDIQKLRAYRYELGYCHALFIRFGIGDFAGTVSECEWV